MNLMARQKRFSWMLMELLQWAYANGYEIRGGDWWRSTDTLACPNCKMAFSYQDLLFFNKRSKVKYGDHNDRCATDLLLSINGQESAPAEYRPLGEYWESLDPNAEWGGRYGVKLENFKIEVGWDPGHFALRRAA